jgi:UDP-glucose 4-epimerase
VLELAQYRPAPPWMIFASSREVYGQADALPVSEDTPLRPVNVYGRSKVTGEQLVDAARRGMRACVVRLSNVYGCTHDHADRVVPAFSLAAVLGAVLRVDGAGHTFDFTHVDDTTRGIAALVEHLDRGGEPPPPVQFLTGAPTTLGQLASLAISLAGGGSIVEAPPRSFDVSRFYGSAARAQTLLDWLARISIEDGLARLIEDFRATRQPVSTP